MLVTNLFALVLIALSGLLIDGHLRARQRLRNANDVDERARLFQSAQHRRRMVASAVIGVVGALIALRPLVPIAPVALSLYLLFLVGASGLLIVLAVIDAFATSVYYRRLRDNNLAARADLTDTIRSSSDPECG